MTRSAPTRRVRTGPLARVLAGTTWRGRAFLGAGLVLLVVGLAAREQQVLRVGMLALAVPLAGAALVTGSRGGLVVTRSLDRQQIRPGETAVLTLTVTNPGRVPVAGAVLVQPLSGALTRAGAASTGTRAGTGARRRVGPLRGGEDSTAALGLTAASRGHHVLPDAVVTVTDPFGTVRRSRSGDGDAPTVRPTVLTVTPATTRLDGRPGDGPAGAAALGRGRSVGVAGEQDSSVREYAPGDDVRRIHWRSSAHRGELMVRQEEQPWQARLTVVLDTRADAFTGAGADSTFEWAVAAAASVVDHAARLGYEVDLVADAGRTVPGPGPGPGPARGRSAGGRGTAAERTRVAAAALDRLVDLHPRPGARSRGPGSTRDPICGAPRTSSGPTGGVDTVVAVLGSVGVEDLPELSGLRTGRTTTIALLVDADAAGARSGGPAEVRAALAAQGWQTGVVTRADGIREAWDAARGAGRSGAGRAGAPLAGVGRSGVGRSGVGRGAR